MEGKTFSQAACPMAAMCKGMVENRGSWVGLVMMIPGVVLIALGVLVIVDPRILIWMVAAALIVFGLLMLTMVAGLRRLGARMGSTGPR